MDLLVHIVLDLAKAVADGSKITHQVLGLTDKLLPFVLISGSCL